jgi:hypothetical protein
MADNAVKGDKQLFALGIFNFFSPRSSFFLNPALLGFSSKNVEVL